MSAARCKKNVYSLKCCLQLFIKDSFLKFLPIFVHLFILSFISNRSISEGIPTAKFAAHGIDSSSLTKAEATLEMDEAAEEENDENTIAQIENEEPIAGK